MTTEDKTPSLATLGTRLKAARGGMSQIDAAKEFGVSPQTIWSWETDQSSPKAAQLVHICNIYGTSPEWLLYPPKYTSGDVTVIDLPRTRGAVAFVEMALDVFTRHHDGCAVGEGLVIACSNPKIAVKITKSSTGALVRFQ